MTTNSGDMSMEGLKRKIKEFQNNHFDGGVTNKNQAQSSNRESPTTVVGVNTLPKLQQQARKRCRFGVNHESVEIVGCFGCGRQLDIASEKNCGACLSCQAKENRRVREASNMIGDPFVLLGCESGFDDEF